LKTRFSSLNHILTESPLVLSPKENTIKELKKNCGKNSRRIHRKPSAVLCIPLSGNHGVLNNA
jgi:hypothetical protein